MALAERIEVAGAVPSPRAQRFARRLRGETLPGFADVMRCNRIERDAHGRRDEVAAILALLQAKPALDGELCGRRLGALAARVGEDSFDRVCAVELPGDCRASCADDLPGPAELDSFGHTLLARLDRDPAIARLAEIAVAIVTAAPGREA